MADTFDLFIAQQCLMKQWATKAQLRECMKLAKNRSGQRLEDMLIFKKYLTTEQMAEIYKIWRHEKPSTTISCPTCSEVNDITDYHSDQLYFCNKCGHILPNTASKQPGNPTKSTAPSEATEELRLIPSQFGPYKILSELGRGGMGIVYQVKHPDIDFALALKILMPSQDSVEQSENVMRFFREIELASQIHHPNIVAIHEVGSYNGCPYYTMDYIEGQTLDKILRNNPPFSEKEALEIMEKVAGGVACAHRAQIIHRDIKPANIILDKNRRPFLMDFGIATCRDQIFKKLTRTGTIMGTPEYMSPEQASGQTNLISFPSDVYSLGATLYHMVAGVPPYQSASPLDTITKVVEGKPIPLRQIAPHISRRLESVIMMAMAFCIEDRYPNATVFAVEIRSLLSGASTIAKPFSPWKMKFQTFRKNLLIILCFFVTGIAMAIATFFVMRAWK